MKSFPANCQTRAVRRVPGAGLAAFSLVEVLVVVALLSFIVVALMGVFSSTQAAWRANMTQTDVLESGRATTDMIAQDLALAAPSGVSNGLAGVNFSVTVTNCFTQSLVGAATTRSNITENIFLLKHENNRWWGVGYAVDINNINGIASLYRLEYPADSSVRLQPETIFTNAYFRNFFAAPTNGVHLLDGVLHLRVRAYDPDGIWMTNGYANLSQLKLKNVQFFTGYGEVGFQMYGNSLPAAVELELGIVEDRTLQRAEVRGVNYLQNQAGKVHVFRQRVPVRNFDPAAYQ